MLIKLIKVKILLVFQNFFLNFENEFLIDLIMLRFEEEESVEISKSTSSILELENFYRYKRNKFILNLNY